MYVFFVVHFDFVKRSQKNGVKFDISQVTFYNVHAPKKNNENEYNKQQNERVRKSATRKKNSVKLITKNVVAHTFKVFGLLDIEAKVTRASFTHKHTNWNRTIQLDREPIICVHVTASYQC